MLQIRELKKQFREKGKLKTIIVKYGIDESFGLKNNQIPSFAITSSVYQGAKCADSNLLSCGCNHKDIVKYVPKLAHLIKWHLVDRPCKPMCYVENSSYWWVQASLAKPVKDAFKYFKSTVVYGAIEERPLPNFNVELEGVKVWLEERLPRLAKIFEKEMEEAGVLKNL